jgi:hypothetical protein
MKGQFYILMLILLLVGATCIVSADKQGNQKQTPRPQPSDESILNIVASARDQVDNFVDVLAVGALKEKVLKREVDVQKAEKLLNQIDLDRKNEKHWEQTVWTIANSDMFPGESIQTHLGTFLMMEGTESTMRQRFPDCEKMKQCAPGLRDSTDVVYVVNAPLDVKAHILMEGLRHGISHWAAIQDFEGSPADDGFTTAWIQAWFDARNVYCRHSPGSKFFDLSNQEQTCK